MKDNKPLSTEEITKKIETALDPDCLDLEISDRTQTNKKIVATLKPKETQPPGINYWKKLIPVVSILCAVILIAVLLPIFLNPKTEVNLDKSTSEEAPNHEEPTANIKSTKISIEELQNSYSEYFIPKSIDESCSFVLYSDINDNSKKYLQINFENSYSKWQEFIMLEKDYRPYTHHDFTNLTKTEQINDLIIHYKETDTATYSSFKIGNCDYYFWFEGQITDFLQFLSSTI